MYCDVCGGIGIHKEGCPEDTTTARPQEICCECHEGIFVDDEYVENIYGETMHYDCCRDLTTKELIQWMGFEIKRMKDCD